MQTPFPTTRPFTSAALTGSADIHAIQAFYGSIASIDDALILIEAVRRRKAPRVHHRLTEDEQLAIGSGSIFVWNEEEAQIKRWTDGRHWSNSRMKGRFFMYKELAASKKTGTRRGRVAVAAFAAAAATSSSSKLVKGAQSASATSSPQGSTGKDAGSAEGDIHVGVSCAGPVRNDEPAATKVRPRAKLTKKRKPSPGVEDESSSDRLFLRKKTISVRTRKNERFHLVAYYFEHEEASLIRPSQVPQFAELPIEPGFYLTGLDATPLMVANPTAIPSSSNLPAGPATAAASVTRAFRPPSPISHGLLPEATYSRHDARHAAPTSRAMTIPTTYLAYGPQYQPMPPPRHPHSTTSAPASLAPPPPPSAAATAPYPQTWPPYPSSAVAVPYNPHAPFNYYTDGPSSHSAPADYYASGYSHTQSGWGYATGEPRDRDYPQYEPSRPTSYAPGANRALRTTDPPSAGAPSGSSDARANEALHSPTSAHSNSPGSWEHAPLHARVDSGSYSRYPTTSRRSVLAPTRNHNLPPPPSSASGYYYPPTPTSYGYGDPFGYHGPPPPPPPPSAGGSMSNGTGYPVYPAASAHSYSAYSEYRGGPAYLDPTVANTYYPQLPTPSSTRPIAMDVASSDSHVEEFVGQDK